MRRFAPLLLASLLAASAAAEVSVRVVPGAPGAAQQVELVARAAPLAEVLDRLARQIGMKVVYEGAHPRQLVTLSLQGRSPVETVLGLLEGQGLNYAILSDTTGTRVETLLVAGSAPPAASSASSARSTPTSPFRRPTAPPPGSGPDTMDEPEDVEEDELDEPVAEAPDAAGADGGAPADPAAAGPAAPQAPGFAPTPPSPSFPVSPFAPQATPYTPQPFPPVPPGAPVATPAQPQPEQTTTPPPGA